MRRFVRSHINHEDAVYTEYAFYFELRDYARFVAVPFYYTDIPQDEAKNINVALVLDREHPDLTQYDSNFSKIGDGWRKVATFPTPEMLARLKGRSAPEKFTLYRRNVAGK
jgi:hypothetical protein